MPFKSIKKEIINLIFPLVFVFFTFSCTTISPRKYGFEGEYIRPFKDGTKYIRPAEDAPRATFILRESKTAEPELLLRLSIRSYGYWFNLAQVQLVLPEKGKTFLLSGAKKVWGKPKEPVYSTTILSKRLLVQKYPMTQLINERPHYDGQVYHWTEDLGQDILGQYRYRIYTGRYNIDYVSDYTYESLYVSKLSDEDLKLIAEAPSLTLFFISEDENRQQEKCQYLDNRSFIKSLVFRYYEREKERWLKAHSS